MQTTRPKLSVHCCSQGEPAHTSTPEKREYTGNIHQNTHTAAGASTGTTVGLMSLLVLLLLMLVLLSLQGFVPPAIGSTQRIIHAILNILMVFIYEGVISPSSGTNCLLLVMQKLIRLK